MRNFVRIGAALLMLAAGTAGAFADDEESGGALDQLQNATSGSQTLSQTYGDSPNDPGCPYSCPDGSELGNIPEPPPPSPADGYQEYWQSESMERGEKSLPSRAARQSDEWQAPEPKVYHSANRLHRFTVMPAKGTLFAQGRLEKSDAAGKWSLLWNGALANEVAPVRALVLQTGAYVVTIDDWYSAGTGKNAVVIYGSGGKIVRALSLTEMLPAYYIAVLPRSLGSIWWGGEHGFSKDGTALILKINLPAAKGSARREYGDLRVQLASGKAAKLAAPVWRRALAKARALSKTKNAS